MITVNPDFFILFIMIVVAVIALDVFVTERFFFRYMFSYEIRKNDILVRLFHFVPIYKVPFNKIIAIRNAPFHEVVLVPGMHLSTRLFARRVAIEMKDRWIIFAFFTPENPDAFIVAVKRRLAIS